MLFVAILFLLLGGLFVALGLLIWKKEKITLIHDYHWDKVAESDKKAYCTLSGIGVLVIGVGMLLCVPIFCMTDSPIGLAPFAIGFVVGLILLIAAGRKYNR